MINDEQFERKLASELRQVTIPSGLQAELFDLSNQLGDNSEPIRLSTETQKKCSDQKLLGWGRVWASAALVAGLGASLWWGWSSLRPERKRVLAEQQPVAIPVNENKQSQTRAEELAEIDRLRSELRELERAYEALEREESAASWAEKVVDRRMMNPRGDVDRRRAELIFWTAETSLFSGLKTNAVREQLLYVIGEFPESESARRAQALLADF